jgi:hypothetical protein
MGFPVKLNRTIEAIEFQTDESTAYLDKKTGDVIVIMEDEFNAAENQEPLEEYPEWQRNNIKKAREIIDREEDFLSLPTKYDIHEYRIIEDFCHSLIDSGISETLFKTIHGKGAFRRFRDAIQRLKMDDEWYKYRNGAIRQIAIDWCEANDITYSDD